MRAVLSLAQFHENNGIIPVTDVAASGDIPESFLRKLLPSLIDAGIVETKRGPKGGIRLATSPANITVLDVVEAVEGKVGLNRCVKDPSHCEFAEECPMYEVWEETTDFLRNHLEGYSLEQLHNQAQALHSQEAATSPESL